MSTRGGNAELIDQIRYSEIRRVNTCERGAELGQRAKYACCIVRAGLNPDVQIFGEARFGIEHYRIAAYDQVFSAAFV
jgi:hypothetical protein